LCDVKLKEKKKENVYFVNVILLCLKPAGAYRDSTNATSTHQDQAANCNVK
jgi:hypothetical protein